MKAKLLQMSYLFGYELTNEGICLVSGKELLVNVKKHFTSV